MGCRELFDVEAFLKALVAELNSFNAGSPADSLPYQFLQWVSTSLRQTHVVFDAIDCVTVDVEEPLALVVLEVLFLGQTSASPGEMYRGLCLQDLFILPAESKP